MYRHGDSLILSPSDLTNYIACAHLTSLERQVANGLSERPTREDPEGDLLARHGDEHELGELARLEASGLRVVRIDNPGPSPEELQEAEQRTLAAMQEGIDVIHQASFFDGTWRGHADFLFKVDVPSLLGTWSYEVADAKLARRVRASALVQMVCYSEQVARLQGCWPEFMTIIDGTGERQSFPVGDATSYVQFAKVRLLEALSSSEGTSTYPTPVQHCRRCAWEQICDARRRSDDHLSLVAGIRGDQVVKLSRAGISTMKALAKGLPGPVERMGSSTVDRLHHQARLQVASREDGELRYELLDVPQGVRRGLAGLPTPSPGDLFVDFEGDPWVGEDGLEYLFGVVSISAQGEPIYQAFWAHDEVDEKKAFESFIDRILQSLDAHPAMHVYHYAPYEVQAMKKLMSRYSTREAELDRILRGEVMVDLYRVVTQGVRCSLESYGLKKLEPFYWPHRDAAIADGAASVNAYETWRETRDGSILQELQEYNELDCRSTLALRDWLEELRVGLEEHSEAPIGRFESGDAGSEESEVQLRRREEMERNDSDSIELVARLLEDLPEAFEVRDAVQQAQWLLAQLVGWHRREAKPKWWAWFERLVKTDEQLVVDTESIGELSYVDEQGRVANSRVHRYRFDPSQEFKIAEGDSPCDPRTGKSAGTVVALDRQHGFIDLKRGVRNEAPHPYSLVPPGPLDDSPLRNGVARVGKWVLENRIDAPGPYRALRDVLMGRPPRFRDFAISDVLVGDDESGSDAAVRLAPLLDESYLAVQGPPGSGKTFTGARLIVALVKAGHQVGITAHSHKAIDNLVEAVCSRARKEGVELRAVRKVNQSEVDEYRKSPLGELVQAEGKNEVIESLVAEGKVDVVAGTAWLMARETMNARLHTLVIDEAGQFSLANLVAIGGAGSNLVLLGDPRQLAQPTQAIHPQGADVSALDHLLDGASTIASDRGVFLDHSFRMHPDICSFVSQLAYDGRLRANKTCERLKVETHTGLPKAGLAWLPVQHESCRTSSLEEAEVVAGLVDGILGSQFTDATGAIRQINLDDIMVISPYNAQVALLGEHLRDGIRIGTVDRFQGQEAPVVLYCLAASSAEDIPRGIDFLFSPNRFNVAISRAQALAVLIGSSTLLSTRCHRPEQLALVNSLCRYVDSAQLVELDSTTGPLVLDRAGQ